MKAKQEKKYSLSQKRLFNTIPKEASYILENFDSLLQDIKPLGSKQMYALPNSIRDLSHKLTDDRTSRHLSYMNETTFLSAYTRYFMWWNLYRLVHLFAGLPSDAFSFLNDNDYCLDLGSGPLTVPVALWLARPELRTKKISWYCLDLSARALSLGEEIFLSTVAKTIAKDDTNAEPWKIIRIRGSLETKLKNNVSAVFSANMFNELFWNSKKPLEEEAKKHASSLSRIPTKKNCSFLVIEPGIPRAGRFISLMRTQFIKRGFSIISPCTHEKKCPMEGQKGGKWCHFVLSTEKAPKKLQKLSTRAGLTKDRATLSFIFAKKGENNQTKETANIRIVSDLVRIPGKGDGRYACAPWGLTLFMEPPKTLSGNILKTDITESSLTHFPIDKKTAAKMI